ncbi:PH domain-containing protein [uncultured Schumannella sp.]|uniref:PH domain-containing protein n=1 Tax=uncultured Schumannella sp. TaxID=1195956 RepID=UPI0025FAB93F|nr:PH domain-containing protein [uncultured Schumannella sp.]
MSGTEPARRAREDLLDGAWHRLHPATPLLRGGVALIAILAFVIANLRDQFFEWVVPGIPSADNGDPLGYIVDNGYIVVALLVVAALLLVLIAGFYLSWRMHTFRITDEVVEVRSGVIFRTNRKGRLDRIQGINITRPLIARLFGAAKLEVNVAGQDANVQLHYLASATADALRAEILRLASGARGTPVEGESLPAEAAGATANASLLDRRLAEFTAPELDPKLAARESIVAMPIGRVLGSAALSGGLVLVILLAILATLGVVLAVTIGGDIWALPALGPVLFGFIPGLIAVGSYSISRLVKSLRFTVAATPDGVRIGYGLLSTTNETLPPGRIHSISISQPLLWRPFDWWEVKVNRAGTSSAQGAGGRQNTTILPVGSRADAFRVLELVLPSLEAPEVAARVSAGLDRGTPEDGYTTSPRRAAVWRWFSWRRNGFALLPDSVLLRRGAIWRELVIVPAARMQSVALTQGPIERRMRLAVVQPHTVAGPISARLGALDEDDAARFFRDVAALGIAAAERDRSHHWRADREGA